MQITVLHFCTIIDAYQATNRSRGIVCQNKSGIGKRVVDSRFSGIFSLSAADGTTHQAADGIIQVGMDDRHGHRRMDFAIQHIAHQTTRCILGILLAGTIDIDRSFTIRNHGRATLHSAHQTSNVGRAHWADVSTDYKCAVDGTPVHTTKQAIIGSFIPAVALANIRDIQILNQMALPVIGSSKA